MKKISILCLLSLLIVSILALGVNALTITINTPASSGTVYGTYNFTVTLSAFSSDANVTNCSFATTDDGVFAWTQSLGNTTSYWNSSNTASTLTETASTTITVKCYNYSNGGLLGTGTATTVIVDNSNPVCSCNLGRPKVSLFQPIEYDCSASSDAYTSITYSCVTTYADGTTETETNAMGEFSETDNLGEASTVCTITDGAVHTNTCSTLYTKIEGNGEQPRIVPTTGKLTNKQMSLLFIVIIALIGSTIGAVFLIKSSKKKH